MAVDQPGVFRRWQGTFHRWTSVAGQGYSELLRFLGGHDQEWVASDQPDAKLVLVNDGKGDFTVGGTYGRVRDSHTCRRRFGYSERLPTENQNQGRFPFKSDRPFVHLKGSPRTSQRISGTSGGLLSMRTTERSCSFRGRKILSVFVIVKQANSPPLPSCHSLRSKDSYHLWFSVELPYEELGLS